MFLIFYKVMLPLYKKLIKYILLEKISKKYLISNYNTLYNHLYFYFNKFKKN